MNKQEKLFIETVWEYYRRHGRRSLPWRRTTNPYRVLVSEIMLQQTQVERVIPKYKSFLKRFPNVHTLAEASLGDVLREWQGLGYNRRAKMLHECAKTIIQNFRGLTPNVYEELMTLPGVGLYTAGAVLAFAYNIPVPVIETNIRTVYLHHFFKKHTNVPDSKIFRLIERTLDRDNAREWYYALMDYGAFLKQTVGNQNIRSKHHTRQSVFKGSDREVRGAIIRLLLEKNMTRAMFYTQMVFAASVIDTQLSKLCTEDLVVQENIWYKLP